VRLREIYLERKQIPLEKQLFLAIKLSYISKLFAKQKAEAFHKIVNEAYLRKR
jgi:hypothetical protein